MTQLRWGALPNVRALAGGRLIRSPRLDELHDLAPLIEAGVVTVIDLRNDDEVAPVDLPAGIARVVCPVEVQDREFMAEWGDRLNSPVYYEHAVRRWPELFVAVFRAIAAAGPGTVLIHCAGGRDRTGLVVAMLLQLLGVSDDEIVADYALGVRAMNAHFAASPNPREPAKDAATLDLWVEQTSAALSGSSNASTPSRCCSTTGSPPRSSPRCAHASPRAGCHPAHATAPTRSREPPAPARARRHPPACPGRTR